MHVNLPSLHPYFRGEYFVNLNYPSGYLTCKICGMLAIQKFSPQKLGCFGSPYGIAFKDVR